MTTREIEVPKIPENTENVVKASMSKYLSAYGALDKFLDRIIYTFDMNSKEYDYFFKGEEAKKRTLLIFALGEYEVVKEQKYVIKLPVIDRDGAENYLDIDEIGYWGMENKVCNSTKFIMDEIENNPQLAPLKQFAVEV